MTLTHSKPDSNDRVAMPYFPHIPVPLNEFDTHQALFNNIKAGEPASLPVSNSTHSFWLHPSKEVNPLAKEGSDGPLINDADLCIIGSGMTGISAAYHISKMSEKPMKVVILEARDFCKFSTYKIRLKILTVRQALELQARINPIIQL